MPENSGNRSERTLEMSGPDPNLRSESECIIDSMDAKAATLSDLRVAIALGSEGDNGVTHPTEQAISAAKEFLLATVVNASIEVPSSVLRPYEIAALPNRGLEAVWKKDLKRLDVLFGNRGELSYLLVDDSGEHVSMEERHGVKAAAAIDRLRFVLG